MTSDAQIEEAKAAMNSGELARARKLLLPLAGSGNGKAQYYLGVVFSIGNEHEFDKNEAIRWHEAALANGIVFSAYQLANLLNPDIDRMWKHFNVPPHDSEKSVQLYARAAFELPALAEQGNATAASILGEIYLTGLGVAADPQQAAHWFAMDFQNGGYGSSNALWSLYSGGYFPDFQDDEKAVYWYRQMRQHKCQCLADPWWEQEMVEKRLLLETEMSRSDPELRGVIPRVRFGRCD
jgi:TPR repeat protein